MVKRHVANLVQEFGAHLDPPFIAAGAFELRGAELGKVTNPVRHAVTLPNVGTVKRIVSGQHFACASCCAWQCEAVPTFKVQRFRDGKPLTAETVLAGSAASAVERVAGKGLVTEGETGKHVARVRLPKTTEWIYYYLPSE